MPAAGISLEEPIFLGADDRAGWIRLASALLDWASGAESDDVLDVAGTLNVGLPTFRFRVGLCVRDFGGLRRTLQATIGRLDAGDGSLLGESGAFHWPGESRRWGWLHRGGTAWDWSRWGLRPDWRADASDRGGRLQGAGCATWVLTGMERPRGAWQEGDAVAIEAGSPGIALAALYARGVPIDLGPWYAGRGTRPVDFARPPGSRGGLDLRAKLKELSDALQRARSRRSVGTPAAAGGLRDRPRRFILRSQVPGGRALTIGPLIRLLADLPEVPNRLAGIEIHRFPVADCDEAELDRVVTPLAAGGGWRVTLRDRSEAITAIADRGGVLAADESGPIFPDQGVPAPWAETADDPDAVPGWGRIGIGALSEEGLVLTGERQVGLEAGEDVVSAPDAALVLLQRAVGGWVVRGEGTAATACLARVDEVAWDREVPLPARVALRVRFLASDPDEVRADADLVAPDGEHLAVVRGAVYRVSRWRFAIRSALRSPEEVRIGEAFPLGPDAMAVWLEMPGGDGTSCWDSALDSAWLGDEERGSIREAGGPPDRRRQRAWGRIAAKEAALQLWRSRGGIPIAPMSLHIWSDERGGPHLGVRPPHVLSTPPVIGIAHHGRVAVAIAAAHPWEHAGVDVEAIAPRSPGFESLAFTADERRLLDGLPDRDEWIARLWCAKESAAKGTGWGLAAGPPSAVAVAVEPESGRVTIRLGEALAVCCPRLAGRDLVARTGRRGDLAWGWLLCR